MVSELADMKQAAKNATVQPWDTAGAQRDGYCWDMATVNMHVCYDIW